MREEERERKNSQISSLKRMEWEEGKKEKVLLERETNEKRKNHRKETRKKKQEREREKGGEITSIKSKHRDKWREKKEGITDTDRRKGKESEQRKRKNTRMDGRYVPSSPSSPGNHSHKEAGLITWVEGKESKEKRRKKKKERERKGGRHMFVTHGLTESRLSFPLFLSLNLSVTMFFSLTLSKRIETQSKEKRRREEEEGNTTTTTFCQMPFSGRNNSLNYTCSKEQKEWKERKNGRNRKNGREIRSVKESE